MWRRAGYSAWEVQKLVPDAKFGIAHGQMSKSELEDAMIKFVLGETDVLVCTTIIESGLDIPNANTILINDADRFGLAEMHQLRGRVGRYKHRAYAYLLLPATRSISPLAARRLKAIEEYSHLGAGFRIALRDLEIRGAGNILGAEQSGHIQMVGYQMYCEMLANTVRLDSVSAADFDAVFYPGGHGPLWDLAEDRTSIDLIEAFAKADKPVAAVCHAPGVLRHVKGPDGEPLVKGRKVAGFTNSEEEAVGLTDVVPFLVEDMLKANGGDYSKGPDWGSYVVTDGRLVTGQNPASSREAAEALLKLL